MTLRLQQAKIEVTTLSPVHIGNGEQLSPVGEFFTTQEKVYFLDNDKLIEVIEGIGKREEYIQKILEKGIELDFYKVLKEWDIDSTQFAKRTINLNQLGLLSSQNNILHQCIKTNEEAYIPGSSLKGLFRTAMIIHFFNENSSILQKVEESISEKLLGGQGKSGLGKLWTKIEKKYFPDFVFHALRLTDSATTSDKNLVIEQMSRVPFYESEGDGKGVDWLFECIQSEQSLATELSIFPKFEKERIKFYHEKNNLDINDFHIENWDYLRKADISKIFKILNDYSLILIDFEIALLQKTTQNKDVSRQLISKLENYKKSIVDSEGKYAIARLGKGKTMFFQTILPILSEDLREKILDLYREEPSFDFPRTRVLSVKDNEMTGWVKFLYDESQQLDPVVFDKEAFDDSEKPKQVSQPPKPVFIPLEERKLYDNVLKGNLQIGISLKAYYYLPKEISFKINGELWESVQLVRPKGFLKNYNQGELIDLVIQQITKAGKINQVKLI